MNRPDPIPAIDAILEELERLRPLVSGLPQLNAGLGSIEERCKNYRNKLPAVVAPQLSYISDLAAGLLRDAPSGEVSNSLQLISSIARYQIDVRSEAEKGRHHAQ